MAQIGTLMIPMIKTIKIIRSLRSKMVPIDTLVSNKKALSGKNMKNTGKEILKQMV